MNLAKQGFEKYQESQSPSPAPNRTSTLRSLLYLRLTAISHRLLGQCFAIVTEQQQQPQEGYGKTGGEEFNSPDQSNGGRPPASQPHKLDREC